MRADDAGSTNGGIDVGGVEIELVDEPDIHGASCLVLVGLADGVRDLDGVPVEPADRPPAEPTVGPTAHPNHVVRFDHVVLTTPDLDRTAAALDAAGFDLRRRRDAERDGEEVHQLFYWAGEVILEVVLDPRGDPDRPASCWGLALTVDDLDATAELLGDLLSGPRDAVQHGRRIGSLRREAGLSLPVAFMSPHPSR